MNNKFILPLEWINYTPIIKERFISYNLKKICKEIARAGEYEPPNYKLCNEIVQYLSSDDITIICNKYINKMSPNVINYVINYIKTHNHHFIDNIVVEDINNFKFILLKSKRSIFTFSEVEHIFKLIRYTKVYTMDILNLLLEISSDIDDNIYNIGCLENTLLELTTSCCLNISNFNIKEIIPINSAIFMDIGKPLKLASKVIEIIIALTCVIVDENVIDHLRNCNIDVQNPERFINIGD